MSTHIDNLWIFALASKCTQENIVYSFLIMALLWITMNFFYWSHPGAPLPPPPPPHHLPPQYHPPQPVYGSYVPPLSSSNDVRTLFIAGLPEDVKPREIYNLFREFPGYESSHLRSPNNTSQAFAFAVFSNQQSAIPASHALNGMVFDLEKGSTPYIDLAESNSRAKRARLDDKRAVSDKKARGSEPSWPTPDSGVSSIHMPGMGNPAFNTNMIGYPPAQIYGNADGLALHDNLFPHLKKCSTPYIPTNTIPCATLFVANLGPSCNEQELNQVFSRFPGYLKLKMQSTYGAPVSFVDFKDVETATAALNSLQGTILYSSAAGEGIRLEYPLATSVAFSLSGFTSFLFGVLHVFTSCLWYFLNNNLDMPNRGWVCGGRRSKLCAGKWKRKNQKEKLTMEKSRVSFLRNTLAFGLHYYFYF